MACDLFKPRLAGLVYDDLSPEDRAAVEAHLAICPGCSAALERLAATRSILADAQPEVPRAPRLVVLAPRRPIPVWASFAAGIVLAAIVGGAGFLAGSRGPSVSNAPASASFDVEQARAIAREETRRQLEAITAAGPAPAAASTPAPDALTRDDLRAELAGFERRLQRERAQDVSYVLDQIAASETRSRDRIGATQQALRYVALSNNPGLGEY